MFPERFQPRSGDGLAYLECLPFIPCHAWRGLAPAVMALLGGRRLACPVARRRERRAMCFGKEIQSRSPRCFAGVILALSPK